MSFLDEFTITTDSDNRWCVLPQPQENRMTIGSSTTHVFSLPFVYSEYINYCEVIYKQGVNIILIKKDFLVQEANEESAGSILRVTLSQEDTCKFKYSASDAFVQLKIINYKNEVSYSNLTRIKIVSSLDNGAQSTRGYLYKNKINDYLYETAYDFLDYEYAEKYFKENKAAVVGGCTAIRWDGFMARNWDWYYDSNVNFVVRTQATSDHYASIGVTGIVDGFTVDKADSETDKYKLIPFCITDGINEKGLSMSINVCPTWNNDTSRTSGAKYNEVCAAMLIRYCLDRFATVAELKRDLPKHTAIYPIKTMADAGYEAHYLIADETTTTILEIVNNKVVFVDTIAAKQAVATNFHLNGVVLNQDKTIYGPYDVLVGHTPTVENNVEKYALGIERYNYALNLLGRINGAPSHDDMRNILDKLCYTRAYPTSYSPANPSWYTEFVGGLLTVDSLPSAFTTKLIVEGTLFEKRERDDGNTWQTVHSSIYDIKEKKLYITCQEDNDIEYIFAL